METLGTLGLSIPTQTLKKSAHLTFTKEAVMEWRNHLPMADVGQTANLVYHALSDSNKVEIPFQNRFEILELLNTPIQFVCQSLRKHYINQPRPLTDTQITIAELADTLQTEMALGYKLVLEQAYNKSDAAIASKAAERALHYFDHILLRNYQLYSIPKKIIWREIHTIYSLVESKKIKDQQISNIYKSILLLAIIDPFRWRQTDQDLLHDACPKWVSYVEIKKTKPEDNPSKISFNLADDNQPQASAYENKYDDNTRVFDLSKLLERWKVLAKTLEPNELKIKMEHSSDTEYLVGLTALNTLIHFFETPHKRLFERTERKIAVEICVGLTAVHFHINGSKSFQQETGAGLDTSGIAVAESIDLDIKSPLDTSPSLSPYTLFNCTMQNESLHGYCLLWDYNGFPPIQAGDVIALRAKDQMPSVQNETETDQSSTLNDKNFEVAMIRWLKHPKKGELKLGIQKLSNKAKSAGLQIIKEGQSSGYYLRAIILENGILTPILPFKTGSIALLASNTDNPEKIELKKLITATSSYKIFEYEFLDKTKKEIEAKKQEENLKKQQDEKSQTSAPKEDKTGFDSIWSKL